jgi:hypothetical protein
MPRGKRAGSNLQHLPHVHCVVPGVFPAPADLSRLFRRLFLRELESAFRGRQAAVLRQPLLAVDESIRRFLLHVLPDGFYRIRHLASSPKVDAATISRAVVNCSMRMSRVLP